MREPILPWRGWKRLREVRQIVLAIAGALDFLAPPAEARRMVARIPRGRAGAVRAVRHRIHLQGPTSRTG